MRVIKNIFIVGITLIVICLGFFLPEVTSLVQDENNLNRVNRYETNQVTLDIKPTTDLPDTLRLIAAGYSSVSFDEGGVMDPEGVISAIQDFQLLFVEQGFEELSPDYFNSYEVKPILAVSDSAEEAIIVWECVAVIEGHPDSELYLVVDDASGMVVQFDINASADVVGLADDSIASDTCHIWANAWSKYLGYAYTVIDENGREKSLSAQDEEALKNGIAVEENIVTFLDIVFNDVDVRVVLHYDLAEDYATEEPLDSTEEAGEDGASFEDESAGENDQRTESGSVVFSKRFVATMMPVEL